jgi:sterol desaturase/sphingolipid hydroxylase (fatty acid hydroxylase superfamily)
VTAVLARVATGFGAGLLAWTLLEYAIHSWLGHLPKGRILISAEHLKHHRDMLYFTPLPTKVRGAVPVLGVLFVLAAAACGLAGACGFVAALALGWVAYERLHRSIHVDGPRGPYTRWAVRHHLHHHASRPDVNHGVTTPLWDLVFGTYVPTPQLHVPERLRPSVPWLSGR